MTAVMCTAPSGPVGLFLALMPVLSAMPKTNAPATFQTSQVAFQWLQCARKKKDDTRTNVQALLLLQKYFPETLTEKEVDYLNRYYPENVSDYGDDLNICPRRRPDAAFDSENDEPAAAEGEVKAEGQPQPMSDE